MVPKYWSKKDPSLFRMIGEYAVYLGMAALLLGAAFVLVGYLVDYVRIAVNDLLAHLLPVR